MANGFLEVPDGKLRSWSSAFAANVIADAARYGLSDGDAAAYGVLNDAFAAALGANTPAVRNTITTLCKNDARAALLADARLLINKINGDRSVTDADRIGLGLPVRAARSAARAVATPPGLMVWDVKGTTVTLVLTHGESGRGKPPGVVGATLFSAVGDVPPTDGREWTYCGNFGRTTIAVVFPDGLPPGATVWLTAEWMNTRLEPGPRAAGVRASLQNGGFALPAAIGRRAGRATARAA